MCCKFYTFFCVVKVTSDKHAIAFVCIVFLRFFLRQQNSPKMILNALKHSFSGLPPGSPLYHPIPKKSRTKKTVSLDFCAAQLLIDGFSGTHTRAKKKKFVNTKPREIQAEA